MMKMNKSGKEKTSIGNFTKNESMMTMFLQEMQFMKNKLQRKKKIEARKSAKNVKCSREKKIKQALK